MNIMFETTTSFRLIYVILLAISVCSMFYIPIIIDGMGKRYNIKKAIILIVALLILSISTLIPSINGQFKNKVYDDSGILHTKSLSFKDFNNVMEKKESLRFEKSRTGNTVNSNLYNVTDMKNNKNYENCRIKFTPIGDKIRLDNVNCGIDILKERK